MSEAAKAQAAKGRGEPATTVRAAEPARAVAPRGPVAGLLDLQRAVGNRAVVAGLRGGRPLEPDTRALMESRFGRDFGAVRVHADEQAGRTAEALKARAFTVGSDVVVGQGRYAPGTAEGQRLLAHELAHVVQQTAEPGPHASSVAAEGEAARAGLRVAGGQAATVSASAPVEVQRDELLDEELRKLAAASPPCPTCHPRVSQWQKGITPGASGLPSAGISNWINAQPAAPPSASQAAQADPLAHKTPAGLGPKAPPSPDPGAKSRCPGGTCHAAHPQQLPSPAQFTGALAPEQISALASHVDPPQTIPSEGQAGGKNTAAQASEGAGAGQKPPGSEATDVFRGIQPYYLVETVPHIDYGDPKRAIQAGPYTLYPNLRRNPSGEGTVAYYVAVRHDDKQNQWIVGPDSTGQFTAQAEAYANAAAFAYQQGPPRPYEAESVRFVNAAMSGEFGEAWHRWVQANILAGKDPVFIGRMAMSMIPAKWLAAPFQAAGRFAGRTLLPAVFAGTVRAAPILGGELGERAVITAVESREAAAVVESGIARPVSQAAQPATQAVASEAAPDLAAAAARPASASAAPALGTAVKSAALASGIATPSTSAQAPTSAAPTAPASAAPAAPARAKRVSTTTFMRRGLAEVSDPDHPLHNLTVEVQGPKGKEYRWRTTTRPTKKGGVQTGRYEGNESGPTVQGGHVEAYASGAPQDLMIEDADLNQLTGQTIESKGAFSVKKRVWVTKPDGTKGVWADADSVRTWESDGVVPAGTLERALKNTPNP